MVKTTPKHIKKNKDRKITSMTFQSLFGEAVFLWGMK
jgi:hypothetical protein